MSLLGLKYYDYMKDSPLSNLLRQDTIKTENQLTAFSDSSWKYCPETRINTVAYIIFYQGGTINHVTYVPGPVDQSGAESEYNEACNAVTTLAHFRVSNNELLNKDTDIVPDEDPLIILDSKSSACMSKNSKDT